MEFTTSLKKNFDFRKVYNRGTPIANRNLIVYILKNNMECNYLGISVSKKVGNSVIRSKVTRLIRESYRLSEKKICRGYNIVVIARNTAKGLPFFEINNSLLHLLRKHKLLNVSK
ncbi:MAG: ribonuclease P protein component [Clostridiales bacterium]|nr:ribonuclease P protein component [Clostridiales bacterium]